MFVRKPVLSTRLLRACALAAGLALPAATALAPALAQAGDPGTAPIAGNADWWLPRHQQKLQEIAQNRGRINIVFIGDSITNDYELPSTAPQYDFLGLWRRYYGDRGALNLGFSGDTTSNVLWRLENGELDGIKPKVVVILIGTNNTNHGHSTEQATNGIDAVVAAVLRKTPHTHVILLGILPSGISAKKTKTDQAVNLYLAGRYQGDPKVSFIDVGPAFMKDGMVDTSLFMDPRNTPPQPALHPDAYAQARMAAAIEPTVARLLGDTPKAP